MVLVFGGSFNPPTIAHEAIIHRLYEYFKPVKIIIVPTGNYFSWKSDLIDFKHRYHMLELMTQDLDYCYISAIENTDEFLGTYHTLKVLQETYDNIYFVVGADHIKTLQQWKNYEVLIQTFKFILLTRKAYEFDKELLDRLHVDYQIMHFDSDVSSSMIRKDLSKNLDNLNPKVKDYIQKNNLYEEVKV